MLTTSSRRWPLTSRDVHRSPGPRAGALAALVGANDENLRAVLAEVLAELGIALDADLRTLTPDLVLAPIEPEDAREVLLAARSLAGRAPVVGIIAMSDERLLERAAELGATATYAMDTPLDRLRAVLLALLGE